MKKNNIIKSAGTIGTLTFLSRCFGMLRDILIFNYLGGTSLVASAFYIAFTLPNLFRRLFGEGALSASFIPIFIETKNKQGLKNAWSLGQRVGTLLFISLTCISILGVIIFYIISDNFYFSEKWSITFELASIMFPYLIFICLTALSMGMLNASGHFKIPAFSPVLLNVIMILSMIILFPYQSNDFSRIKILSWSVLIAGLAQLLIQVPVLYKKGATFGFLNPFQDLQVKKILFLMAPIALGASVTQFNVIIDRFLAMWIGDWAPAALTFSERLIYLPLGIFATALGTVLLPTFSQQVEDSNLKNLSDTLSQSLFIMFYVMVPATLGLFILAEPIIKCIFDWRETYEILSIQHITRALLCYSPGLLVFSIAKLIIPVFYSLKDTKTPVQIGIKVVVINLLLNLTAIFTLPEYWKHAGMALSTVIAEGSGIYLLVKNLNQKIALIPIRTVIYKFLSVLWRALIMSIIVLFIFNFLTEVLIFSDKLNLLIATLFSILSGLISYALLSSKLPEQNTIINTIFASKNK